MVIYREDTVFDTDAQTIVNTINCAGVMGTGLALEFRLRFPEMYEDYIKRCKHGQVVIGKPYLYRGAASTWILNFPTKYHWKYPSQLSWIKAGLQYFSANYKALGIQSIAFPPLGTNKGGLKWPDVKRIMEQVLSDLEINVYICLDTKPEATGDEKRMVDMINNRSDVTWVKQLRIRSDIATAVISALPIRRFRELQSVPGVGINTYSKLFTFFYKRAKGDDFLPLQPNLL